MFGLDVLVKKVLLLTVMVILGFILRKCKLADEKLSKGFANTVIYLSQPAMIIYGFLEADFSKEILLTSACVFVFALIFHFGYYGLALILYKKAAKKQQDVLKFATVFTNAGFMGIPLISELISPVAAVYATFYVVAFNIFNWSLGCYIYTNDKQYMSAKKMFLNPATIPTYIGFALFLIGGFLAIPKGLSPVVNNYLIPIVKDDVLFLLKSTVIPLSMMMIGIRLADGDFKSMLKDKYMPILFAVRLIIIPLVILSIMKCVALTGIILNDIIIPAATVLVISSSTPVAAMATIFAEKFDGDPTYASKLVSASTVLSMLTMPLIAAIITKVF